MGWFKARNTITLGAILISGCGIHVSSDPIIVTHKLDLSLVEPMCREKCINEPDPNSCTTKCVNDFLLTLTDISVK